VKAAWEQLATERKLAVEARRQKRAPASSDRKEAMKLPRVRAQDKQLTPEQKAKVRDAVRELTEAERIELQSLRKRRREANPAEKRAIQAELNAFWRRVGGKPMSESAKSVTP
jgi:histidinol phosphatase-like enzyme